MDTRVNDSLLQEGDDDMMSKEREQPKVSYICGSKTLLREFTFLINRLWQGEQTRQGFCDQVCALWPQDLLQDEREKASAVRGQMSPSVTSTLIID